MTFTTTAKPGEGPVLLGRFPGADEPGSSDTEDKMRCSNEHFGIKPETVEERAQALTDAWLRGVTQGGHVVSPEDIAAVHAVSLANASFDA